MEGSARPVSATTGPQPCGRGPAPGKIESRPCANRLSAAPSAPPVRNVAASNLAAVTARTGRTIHPEPPCRLGPSDPPLLAKPRAQPLRPGNPSQDHPRLPPGAPPSGEGTATRIERRAPEGVEVVPKALLSSSAATTPFGIGALPGFKTAARTEPHFLRTSRTGEKLLKSHPARQ